MIDRMKHSVVRTIDNFNRHDAATLLCPRKDESGNYVEKGSPGWGAASERAITHRLAVYIEGQLRRDGFMSDASPVVVDCEYNRHLDRAKRHRISVDLVSIVEKAKRTAKPDSDDDSFYVFSIAPDIVVHERGSDAKNLLIIEVKKATNPEFPDYDRLKLSCFTEPSSGYGYKLGAAITIEDNVAPADRRLLPPKWFVNGVAE
jgi:hypothetical protein